MAFKGWPLRATLNDFYMVLTLTLYFISIYVVLLSLPFDKKGERVHTVYYAAYTYMQSNTAFKSCPLMYIGIYGKVSSMSDFCYSSNKKLYQYILYLVISECITDIKKVNVLKIQI